MSSEGRAEVPIPLPDAVFRQIVDQTAVPFVVIDGDGMIVHASTSISLVAGWRAEELVGRNMVGFVEPGSAELALAALMEITSMDDMEAGVPIVFPVVVPGGRTRHLEVAAMPLSGPRERDLIALRLRSWESQRHMSDFVRAMVSGEPLAIDLEVLTRALTASLEGVGAAVHHGFDGNAFLGVAGSWPGAADLPLDDPSCVEALGQPAIRLVAAEHPSLGSIGALTGWLVPIHPRSGLPPAVLSVWRDRPGAPFLGHRQELVQATDFVELAIVRAAENERLVHLARHDPLTGVANRATFRDGLAAALARGERDLAVGFCDLDDFKQVNDRFGHGAGDEVLVEVASRLRGCLRGGDELARAGGDEFTILWRNIPDADAAHAVACRVVTAGAQELRIHDAVVRVGVSVGVALAGVGATAESLLAVADAALYESKQAGGGRATTRRG